MNRILIRGYYHSYNVKFSHDGEDTIHVSVPGFGFNYAQSVGKLPDLAKTTLKTKYYWTDPMLSSLESELKKPINDIAKGEPYLGYNGKFVCNHCTESIEPPVRRWARKEGNRWLYFIKKHNDILCKAQRNFVMCDEKESDFLNYFFGCKINFETNMFDDKEISFRLYHPKK